MKALQNGEAGDLLRRFFTQDARQIGMPNQLNPRGQESNLEQILQRSLRGQQILKRQLYEIISEMAQEERVAVEARWTGILAVSVGTLEAGAEMKASFAMFFQFREGKIAKQRNYDCFDAWRHQSHGPRVANSIAVIAKTYRSLGRLRSPFNRLFFGPNLFSAFCAAVILKKGYWVPPLQRDF
jgi:hypothetical protein